MNSLLLRSRLLSLTLLALLAGPTASYAATVSWTNPAGGAWNVGTNWSGGLVPGVADDVEITGAASFTVIVAGNPTINSISLGGGAGVQTLQMNSQTMTLAAASSFTAGSILNLTAATLTGAGGVTLAGTTVVTGSSSIANPITTAASSVLRVSGSGSQGIGTLTVANGFTNLGAIELTNSAAGWAATLNVTAGTLVNAPGATLNVLAGSGGGGRTLGLALDNQGTVTIGQAATLSRASAQHLNSGTISLTGGDLTLSQSGTAPSFTNTGTIAVAAARILTMSGSSAFTNAATGTLSGSGTIVIPASITFVDAGTIRPGTSAGALTITGVCPMTSTSQLAIELGGATLGTGYDQLAVSGVATLDGLLEISLIGGFEPAIGQSFQVLTCGSRAGIFSSISGLQLPGDLALEPRYSATGLTLVVVSQTWVQLIPDDAPPTARDGHTAVTDASNARMIVFGGRGDAGPLSDVWVLTGADGQGGYPTWVQLAPTGTPPPARHQHAAVYDAANNRMIVFGGDDAAPTPTAFGDIWVLTNANGLGGAPAWIAVSPSGGPGNRSGASAIYDAPGNRMIVFGGSSAPATCGSAAADVWVLAGANGIGVPAWTMLTPSGSPPTGRMGHRAGYDTANNRMIAHGGFQPCAAANGETWILSSANGVGSPEWTLLAPTGTPAAALWQSAVLEPTSNRLIVFGGEVASTPTSAVSTLAGANGLAGAGLWFDPATTSGPVTARSRHSGAPLSERMIVFGGLGATGRLADAWLLETARGLVVDVPPVDPPAPRVLRTGFSRPPFPNPARGAANFAVALASEQALHLSVCDVHGRRVATLHEGSLPAGEHAFAWSRRDAAGRPIAPGLYFLRLETRERSETQRLVLMP